MSNQIKSDDVIFNFFKQICDEKDNINNNRQHLDDLKSKSADGWREYATQCMVEILDNKKNL